MKAGVNGVNDALSLFSKLSWFKNKKNKCVSHFIPKIHICNWKFQVVSVCPSNNGVNRSGPINRHRQNGGRTRQGSRTRMDSSCLFSLSYSGSCPVLAVLLWFSHPWCPLRHGCLVLSIVVLSLPSHSVSHVLAVLSWFSWSSCFGCHVLAVLSLLPCLGCHVLLALFWQSCSGCPVLVVMSWLPCSVDPVLTVMFWLSCSCCLFSCPVIPPVVLSWPSYSVSHVLAVLS